MCSNNQEWLNREDWVKLSLILWSLSKQGWVIPRAGGSKASLPGSKQNKAEPSRHPNLTAHQKSGLNVSSCLTRTHKDVGQQANAAVASSEVYCKRKKRKLLGFQSFAYHFPAWILNGAHRRQEIALVLSSWNLHFLLSAKKRPAQLTMNHISFHLPCQHSFQSHCL